jgi:uncharacterized RDD family membrane protein YckC
MSQVAAEDVGPKKMDPYEIGWYIESADEDIYGPVSRKSLRRFLEDKTISPNTLVRHCSGPEAKPAADQPVVIQNLSLDGQGLSIGDKLDEAWPGKKRDRLALAEDSLPCLWHKRPAVLVCLRCHAPYCDKCRARPFRKQFFLCRRCQTGIYNRRFAAVVLDYVILVYIPIIAAILLTAGRTQIVISQLGNLLGVCLLFARDALFRGAGPGKRILRLRVVQSKDGNSPLTFGQGIVRWLSVLIPFFNLFDLSVPYRDPLIRRYGDRWAKTRVIDTEAKLAKLRNKIARRMIKKKGIQPPLEFGMSMEGLAQLS